jgi:hypothetical protein
MKVTKRQFIKVERCPYLGLHDDSSTSLAYASDWNYCYHTTPPASVLVSHQVGICLCSRYVDCTIMVSNKWGRLPRSLQGKARASFRKSGPASRFIWQPLFARIVVFLVLLLALLLVQRIFF